MQRGATERAQLPARLLQEWRRSGVLRAGERVGVAVSGGADSVALLVLLLAARERLGIVLDVVHFNHKLRGKASDADEAFVERLAGRAGLTLHCGRADVAGKAKREKANLEDAARRARYAFFERLVSSGQLTRIAVAHTADDQAETVLAHILRGTGLAGLGGIHPSAGEGRIVRPLLSVRREELRRYLRGKKQKWREDATNRDTARLRARIRKKLLPLAEKEFSPRIVEHLATLAELAREDEAFLHRWAEKCAERMAAQEEGGLRVPVADLLAPAWRLTDGRQGTGSPRSEPDAALSTRVARLLLERAKSGEGQINAQHVEAVMRLAREGDNGKRLHLPGGAEVRRERDTLLFRARRTKTEAKKFEYRVVLDKAETTIDVAELGCGFRFRMIDWPSQRRETSKDTGAVLDRARLREPMTLRNWRHGDRMRPAGRTGAHKLNRLLNEKRVSRWEREGWPVLTSGGTVVWARGLPVAAEFAADEATRTGIEITEESFE